MAQSPSTGGPHLGGASEHRGRTLAGNAGNRGEAQHVSTYYFTDSDAWFYLECVSQAVPPRDWLSIAETFEFLPAGE